MNAQCSVYPADLQRGALSQCQKSFRQNSSFFNNQPLYTPQHTNNQCNELLLKTIQSLNSMKELGCANKLCKNHAKSNQQQSSIDINMETLCDLCQDQFKNDSFCIYCKQVYFDETDDGKEWIMCEQCERWVHSTCADFNTKQNPNAIFKCIKCKKIQNQSGGRRNIPRTGYAKVQKKKNFQFLSSIGFEWQLSTLQAAEDMENIRQYLSSN